jgi:autotransporter translocation and assembly factor TamB
VGLDSQWSGRIKITGTTDAPKIAGTLIANRGSYTLLGKSFRLARGIIIFDGSAKTDPDLDIVAEASAADVTARVVITGVASVSIGVPRGVSPPTSRVTVEVDFGHHVTVSTEAGQNGGTGIGLNYNYDYWIRWSITLARVGGCRPFVAPLNHLFCPRRE